MFQIFYHKQNKVLLTDNWWREQVDCSWERWSPGHGVGMFSRPTKPDTFCWFENSFVSLIQRWIWAVNFKLNFINVSMDVDVFAVTFRFLTSGRAKRCVTMVDMSSSENALRILLSGWRRIWSPIFFIIGWSVELFSEESIKIQLISFEIDCRLIQ